MEKCGQCGKRGDTNSIRRCSRCQAIRYCSRDCQARHWPQHKVTCTPATNPTVSSSSAKNATGELCDTENKFIHYWLMKVSFKYFVNQLSVSHPDSLSGNQSTSFLLRLRHSNHDPCRILKQLQVCSFCCNHFYVSFSICLDVDEFEI